MPERLSVLLGRLDGPVYARGLAEILRADLLIDVLETDLDEAGLEHAVERCSPQVVIVGERIDFVVLERLKAVPRAPRVLVAVQQASRLYATMLAAVGVDFISVAASEVDAVVAVVSIMSGSDAATMECGKSVLYALTPAETRVLRHLELGRSYAEIGACLHISPETVRTHARRIRGKLDVGGRRELIAYSSRVADAGAGVR